LGLTSGGSVTHTSGVINALSKKVDLTVYSNDHLPNVKQSINLIPAILKWLPVFNEIIYNLKLIRIIGKKLDYDFIYQRYSGESFSGAYLSLKAGIPFILEFNSSEVWKLKNWSKTKNPFKNFLKTYIQLPITKRIERYNLKHAHLIVVVSQVLKDNLIAQGIDGNKILVNPNGVEVEKFSSIQKSEAILQKHNLSNKFVVGFIGTFGKWHGVVEMAKAAVLFFEKYPEQRNKVNFLIIGSGKLFPEVEAIIEQSPYTEQIKLIGAIPQEKAPAYLRTCDLFLSPHIKNPDGTKFFGSPTKLFEYMACERPIIASDLDQIGEIFTHGENSHMVTPGNVKELSDAINKLVLDTDYCVKIAKGAFDLVNSKYTWDRHVEHILDKFESLELK